MAAAAVRVERIGISPRQLVLGRSLKQKRFAVNCDLDGRALGGRTAQRRFALHKHHILEIIWGGLMWAFEMPSDKTLGCEESGKSLDWQHLRHFQTDLQTGAKDPCARTVEAALSCSVLHRVCPMESRGDFSLGSL